MTEAKNMYTTQTRRSRAVRPPVMCGGAGDSCEPPMEAWGFSICRLEVDGLWLGKQGGIKA